MKRIGIGRVLHAVATPSTKNCTPATPVSSVASAVTVDDAADLCTVGRVIDMTCGGIVGRHGRGLECAVGADPLVAGGIDRANAVIVGGVGGQPDRTTLCDVTKLGSRVVVEP